MQNITSKIMIKINIIFITSFDLWMKYDQDMFLINS